MYGGRSGPAGSLTVAARHPARPGCWGARQAMAALLDALGEDRGFPPALERAMAAGGGPLARLQNWGKLQPALNALGVPFDADSKASIVAGDVELVEQLLGQLYRVDTGRDPDALFPQREPTPADVKAAVMPSPTPATAVEDAGQIGSFGYSPPPEAAPGGGGDGGDGGAGPHERGHDAPEDYPVYTQGPASCVEFLVQRLEESFDLTPDKSLDLLIESSDVLAEWLTGGYPKGMFNAPLAWVNGLHERAPEFCALISQEPATLPVAFSMIASGLLSSDRELALRTCTLLSSCTQLLEKSFLLKQCFGWLTGSPENLRGVVAFIAAHGGNEVLDTAALLLYRMCQGNLLPFFMGDLMLSSADPVEYLKLADRLVISLTGVDGASLDLIDSGVPLELAQHACACLERDSTQNVDLRMTCLTVMSHMWSLFPYNLKSDASVCAATLAFLQKGCKAGEPLKMHSHRCLFSVLEPLLKAQDPNARMVYKAIIFSLIEHHDQGPIHRYIVENLMRVIDLHPSLPVGLVLEPMIKHVSLQAYDADDVRLLTTLPRHATFSTTHALQAVGLLLKLTLEDEEHGEHVYPVLLQTILKFADEEKVTHHVAKQIYIQCLKTFVDYTDPRSKHMYYSTQGRKQLTTVFNITQLQVHPINDALKPAVSILYDKFVTLFGAPHEILQDILASMEGMIEGDPLDIINGAPPPAEERDEAALLAPLVLDPVEHRVPQGDHPIKQLRLEIPESDLDRLYESPGPAAPAEVQEEEEEEEEEEEPEPEPAPAPRRAPKARRRAREDAARGKADDEENTSQNPHGITGLPRRGSVMTRAWAGGLRDEPAKSPKVKSTRQPAIPVRGLKKPGEKERRVVKRSPDKDGPPKPKIKNFKARGVMQYKGTEEDQYNLNKRMQEIEELKRKKEAQRLQKLEEEAKEKEKKERLEKRLKLKREKMAQQHRLRGKGEAADGHVFFPSPTGQKAGKRKGGPALDGEMEDLVIEALNARLLKNPDTVLPSGFKRVETKKQVFKAVGRKKVEAAVVKPSAEELQELQAKVDEDPTFAVPERFVVSEEGDRRVVKAEFNPEELAGRLEELNAGLASNPDMELPPGYEKKVTAGELPESERDVREILDDLANSTLGIHLLDPLESDEAVFRAVLEDRSLLGAAPPRAAAKAAPAAAAAAPKAAGKERPGRAAAKENDRPKPERKPAARPARPAKKFDSAGAAIADKAGRFIAEYVGDLLHTLAKQVEAGEGPEAEKRLPKSPRRTPQPKREREAGSGAAAKPRGLLQKKAGPMGKPKIKEVDPEERKRQEAKAKKLKEEVAKYKEERAKLQRQKEEEAKAKAATEAEAKRKAAERARKKREAEKVKIQQYKDKLAAEKEDARKKEEEKAKEEAVRKREGAKKLRKRLEEREAVKRAKQLEKERLAAEAAADAARAEEEKRLEKERLAAAAAARRKAALAAREQQAAAGQGAGEAEGEGEGEAEAAVEGAEPEAEPEAQPEATAAAEE